MGGGVTRWFREVELSRRNAGGENHMLWNGFSPNGLLEPDEGLEMLRQPIFRHADMAVVYADLDLAAPARDLRCHMVWR